MDVKSAVGGGGWILALVVGGVAFLGGGAVGDQADPIDNDPIEIIAASGVEGFPVDLFCNDPLTKVEENQAPDAGKTVQLTRVRDNVSESVTIVYGAESEEPTFATHYFDSALGQQSDPAVVNEDARDCIEDKAE